MNPFEARLEKYADLAVKVGVNLQSGQTLVINAPIDAAEYVRKVTRKAYDAGALNVHVEWSDEEVTLIKYKHAPDEAFKQFPMWKAKGYEELAEGGAAFLSILAPNPDLLKEIDPQRVATANKTSAIALENYSRYSRSGQVSWAVVSVPTPAWAAKVFPHLSAEESVEKLWSYIFKATRVDAENPIQAWSEHIENIKSKLFFLNEIKLKKLIFKAPGTDLTIELPAKHLWVGGGITSPKGVFFVPNLPTEEVFTMPLKEGVNGVVSSTKPLNYSGSLIDQFSLTFKNGKIVDFSAKTGYETLKKLIETDEGSHYLGEVALVPHRSPISDLNVIFYNTLFDENASCHLAIGNAYPLCVEGGTKMTKEELEKHGANSSLTHVDFMIGTADMNIDGEAADGTLIPLFRNGNWAD